MYPKILNFRPVTVCTFDMTLSRTSLLPIVVSYGQDQTQLSSRFEARDELGTLLVCVRPERRQ